MFGLGIGEIMLIIVVAIIVLGPEKLPDMIINTAKIIKKIKGEISSAKESIDAELKLSNMKEEAKKYSQELDESVKSFTDVTYGEIVEVKELIDDDVKRTEVKFAKSIEQKKDEQEGKNV